MEFSLSFISDVTIELPKDIPEEQKLVKTSFFIFLPLKTNGVKCLQKLLEYCPPRRIWEERIAINNALFYFLMGNVSKRTS